MKKNTKNKDNTNYPFFDEIKQAKYGFKKMIDEMPDEEFIDFIMLFMDFIEDLEFFDDNEIEDNCEILPF